MYSRLPATLRVAPSGRPRNAPETGRAPALSMRVTWDAALETVPGAIARPPCRVVVPVTVRGRRPSLSVLPAAWPKFLTVCLPARVRSRLVPDLVRATPLLRARVAPPRRARGPPAV